MRKDLEKNKSERIGEISYNTYGTKMVIIEYHGRGSLIVEFQDNYKTKSSCTWSDFQRGEVKNPYDKTVFGIGYIGEGEYSRKKTPKIYNEWKGMLERCYDPYFINKELTYINCFVCEEWLCLQNFAKWYEENYYEFEGQKMHLDKDVLYKGNKIYSPETCCFVPQRINNLFTKCNRRRGDCLIGVKWHKRDRIYEVSCSILEKNGNRKNKYLGRYNSEFQAFTCYKQFKENYIKQVADEYKDLIPDKLYNAMYNYQVEIND